MDTYVFANQKGGVGKTTISLGVAAALAERGVRALLIDLDPQASKEQRDLSPQHRSLLR